MRPRKGSAAAGQLLLAAIIFHSPGISVDSLTFEPLDTNFTPTERPPQRPRSNPAVEPVSPMFSKTGKSAFPTNAWWTSWVQMTGDDPDTPAVS